MFIVIKVRLLWYMVGPFMLNLCACWKENLSAISVDWIILDSSKVFCYFLTIYTCTSYINGERERERKRHPHRPIKRRLDLEAARRHVTGQTVTSSGVTTGLQFRRPVEWPGTITAFSRPLSLRHSNLGSPSPRRLSVEDLHNRNNIQ